MGVRARGGLRARGNASRLVSRVKLPGRRAWCRALDERVSAALGWGNGLCGFALGVGSGRGLWWGLALSDCVDICTDGVPFDEGLWSGVGEITVRNSWGGANAVIFASYWCAFAAGCVWRSTAEDNGEDTSGFYLWFTASLCGQFVNFPIFTVQHCAVFAFAFVWYSK